MMKSDTVDCDEDSDEFCDDDDNDDDSNRSDDVLD